MVIGPVISEHAGIQPQSQPTSRRDSTESASIALGIPAFREKPGPALIGSARPPGKM